jgi:hypothetical protein
LSVTPRDDVVAGIVELAVELSGDCGICSVLILFAVLSGNRPKKRSIISYKICFGGRNIFLNGYTITENILFCQEGSSSFLGVDRRKIC